MDTLDLLLSNRRYWSAFTVGKDECKIYNKSIVPWLCKDTDSLLDVIYNSRETLIGADKELFTYVYNHLNSYNVPVNMLLHLRLGGVFRLIFQVKDDIIVGMLYNNLETDATVNIDAYTKFANHISDVVIADPKSKYAIVQVDIEQFKLLNSKYGMSRGDEILQRIYNNLKALAGDESNCGHLSHDIFAVLCKFTDIKALTETVSEWDKKLSICGDITVRLAWGIYLITDIYMDGRLMLDATMMARQSVKGSALNNIGVYEDTQKQELQRVGEIENRMEQALQNGEFQIYIQPKYLCEGDKLVGGEALVRWRMPDGTMLYPNDFLPIFEKNGFVVKMDMFVWEETCKVIRNWLDEGKKVVPISVNMSRLHLKNMQCAQYFESLIKKYQFSRKYLQLEITETLENICNCETFMALKELGYTLLMDDFGSGYSSLNTLKSTNFDIIKLDKDFLSEFLENPRGQQIVAHTISMVKGINLGVIAEGVETREQADFLKKAGCNIVQGYLYSKPLPVVEFSKLLSIRENM